MLLKNLYMELTGPEFTWKGMNVSAGMASRDRGWDLLLRILQWGDVVGVHDSTFGNKGWKAFHVYFCTHTLKLKLFTHFRAHLFQCSTNPNIKRLEQLCSMWKEHMLAFMWASSIRGRDECDLCPSGDRATGLQDQCFSESLQNHSWKFADSIHPESDME